MLKRLIRYLAAHRLKIGGAVLTMLITAAVELLNPWPLKFVVDNVVGQHPVWGHVLVGPQQPLALLLAAVAYVVLAGVAASLNVLNDRWLTEIGQKMSLAMSGDLYAQVQRLSLRFHDRASVGDIVTRITGDVDQLQDAFVKGLSLLSIDMVVLVGIAVIMFTVDWRFALVALLVIPPLLLLFSSKLRSRIKEASQAVRASEGTRASLAQETFSSIRTVKAFGQEDREHRRFVDQTRSKVEASIRAITWQGVFACVVDVTCATGVAVVLGYGGWRVIRGDLTLGQMLLFMQYLSSLYGPVRGLNRLAAMIQRASASAERIDELFRVAPEVPESPHARVIPRARGQVAFDDVWFAYETARPVLRGIDLEIRPGEVIAMVGSTGAGKSTLASLIPRFYDPTRGRVLLDGCDVRDLRVSSLRSQISIVLQDSLLFAGTIHDNIAYGRPGASDSDVVAAARAAYAHEFIVDFPDGYGSFVGERGVTLSGGERQRIAIARALLKDAPILILDEPTSSVDAESEALIMKSLAGLMRGRTVLIITHRASLIALADRVAVIGDGAITQTARPEDPHVRGPLALPVESLSTGPPNQRE